MSATIFKKILVPVDGSTSSINAEELAALMAKKLGSEVTVIHVIAHEFKSPKLQRFSPETPEFVYGDARPQAISWVHVHPPPSITIPETTLNEISNWYIQRGKEIITEAQALFKEKGVSVDQKLIEYADPAEAVIREAQEGNYALIIIGQSEEEKQEPHLGSVAKKVLFYAPTPVLIARNKGRISKILAPIDGSANAEKALQYAVYLAEKTRAAMTLLYVQESSLFKLKPEVTRDIGNRILSNAAERIKRIKLDQKLESGDPAKVIVQTANNGNYDLIAMGSRGLGVVERFLLGSVSDHVAHYADRSVLIIK
jgi:nucleotide-binding universal stress UspA family protein